MFKLNKIFESESFESDAYEFFICTNIIYYIVQSMQ